MRLTAVVCGPPKFYFWKTFGAGKKPRIPYYKYWWNYWRKLMYHVKTPDKTLPLDKLPPNARVMDAQDFMNHHPDVMPDEILRRKSQRIVYDHPWPHNINFDERHDQKPIHMYSINTRFFVPRDDSLVLTNTVLESDAEQPRPPFEPTDEQLALMQRDLDWATKGDSVLVRLPRKRIYPKINIRPMSKFGITKERMELNVLNSFFETSRSMLTQHFSSNDLFVDSILGTYSLFFPQCKVPFSRESKEMNLNLDLTIDHMSLGNHPLSIINPNPENTKQIEPIDIKPRTWRSLLEKSRYYKAEWSFTLPRLTYPHTISVASRIVRDYRDSDEMLARTIIQAFGFTTQVARLKSYESDLDKNGLVSKKSSVILQDPLHAPQTLVRPIVLQAIGFDSAMNQFHFVRYQLNTIDFHDEKPDRIKNQAWYSGPVTDLKQILRHYLDFHAFGARMEISQKKSAEAM